MKREKEFERNADLEIYLSELNKDLRLIEDDIVEREDILENYPMIFIIGPLRSGTTMTMQWLADINRWSEDDTGIAYPTNLLSRFYEAPIIGSKIQRVLCDKKYNFRNEIMDFTEKKIGYVSNNGKTTGALSPNEFWYFWRHYLPFDSKDFCTNEELMSFKGVERFRKEMNGIANTFEKPFALKGMICEYNIAFLTKIFPKSIFIKNCRQPDTNIEAVLRARERQYGNIHTWLSFKIPEYERLKDLPPELQIAGEIFHINEHINRQLQEIDEKKKLIIPYEEFCLQPEKFYHLLRDKLNQQGYCLPEQYQGIKKFSVSRSSNKKYQAIYQEYIEKYAKEIGAYDN